MLYTLFSTAFSSCVVLPEKESFYAAGGTGGFIVSSFKRLFFFIYKD